MADSLEDHILILSANSLFLIAPSRRYFLLSEIVIIFKFIVEGQIESFYTRLVWNTVSFCAIQFRSMHAGVQMEGMKNGRAEVESPPVVIEQD